MIDLALFAGRLALLALLYLFLFAAVRSGLGLVSPDPSRGSGVTLTIARGPRALEGTSLALDGPVLIGRSPDADIVIGDEFVSARHAKIVPLGNGAVVEDLGSTNGTFVNGERVRGQRIVEPGDVIDIGPVRLKVGRS